MKLIDYIKRFEELKAKLRQLENDLAGLQNVSQSVIDAVKKEADAVEASLQAFSEQNLYTQEYVDRLEFDIKHPWK